MTPPDATSPSMFPSSYHGTFSEEEIHDILGAMHGHDSDEGIDDEPHQIEETPSTTAPAVGESQFPGSSEEISEEARARARSERKRSREKQRREDVNKQFADLSDLLKQIELEDLSEEGCKRLPLATASPINRVDLIARTIVVLQRMHNMNKEKKKEIADLKKQLDDAHKMAEDTAARLKEATLYQQGPSKQFMMMVPMMVNPEAVGGAATAGAGFASMAAPQAFMPQQMMMMPHVPQVPVAAPASCPAEPTSTSQVPSQIPNQVLTSTHQMMMHPQMMPMQQPMMNTMPMMYAPTMATAPVTAAPSSNTAPEQSGKQGPSSNVGGGNVAHCA